MVSKPSLRMLFFSVILYGNALNEYIHVTKVDVKETRKSDGTSPISLYLQNSGTDIQNVATMVISCIKAICLSFLVPFNIAVSQPLIAEKAMVGDNRINANVYPLSPSKDQRLRSLENTKQTKKPKKL